ncbi:MAG: transposase, partial [Proteobacteria bacterium]|nr:transposase [Pseudomonadota bacterium]
KGEYIFSEDKDKETFLEILKKGAEKYKAELYAYCIMGNYFHLLVRMYPEMGLSSEGFKKKYVLYYGKRKKRQADYATSTDKAAIFRIICFPSAVKIFKRIR